MTIEVIKDKKDKDTLKFSKMTLPAEYAVVEKVFKEPMTGDSMYGKWYLYTVRVNELKSINSQTGEMSHSTPGIEASFFASEKLHEQIIKIQENVPIKISKKIEKGAKGEYSKYVAEEVGKKPLEYITTAKKLLESGLDKKIVATQVAAKYNLDVSTVQAEIAKL